MVDNGSRARNPNRAIQGERAVMIGRLDQPDPRETPLSHPIKDLLH
jgi:hypothetical protein